MTQQEIQQEIITLEAKNKSLLLKAGAITAAGTTIALILATRHKRNFWGKVGYFVAGSTLSRSAAALAFSSQATANTARLNLLRSQLHELNINS